MTVTDNAVRLADLLRLSVAIADRAAVSDIEMLAHEVRRDGVVWRDTRPMLDERENSPAGLDMNREALRYAAERGLAVHHPAEPHLVRIARHP